MITAFLAIAIDVVVVNTAVPQKQLNKALKEVSEIYRRDLGTRLKFYEVQAPDPVPALHCKTSTCNFTSWALYLKTPIPKVIISMKSPTWNAASQIGNIEGVATINPAVATIEHKRLVASIAHELGHLLGASHLDEKRRSIMNTKGATWYVTYPYKGAVLRSRLTFARTSRKQIRKYLTSLSY